MHIIGIEITRSAGALSDSIDKLRKTGGFALASGLAGIIMMLEVRLFVQEESIHLIIIDAILIFLCFLYSTIKIANENASKALSDNKGAIAAIQDIVIQLTRLTNAVQSHCSKSIDKISKIDSDYVKLKYYSQELTRVLKRLRVRLKTRKTEIASMKSPVNSEHTILEFEKSASSKSFLLFSSHVYRLRNSEV